MQNTCELYYSKTFITHSKIKEISLFSIPTKKYKFINKKNYKSYRYKKVNQ